MIQHMLKNERKIPYVDETTDEYGLWLIKDNGIYVMSPSPEPDIVSKNKCHVIYARGFSPRVKDCWEKCRDAVGGDDFIEFITLGEDQMKRVALFGELDIRLTETEVSVYA
jgi:hypothetical protein